jgi:predicted enzyme related to lactoylglutathione lyase
MSIATTLPQGGLKDIIFSSAASKIGHVVLNVTDLERAVTFYTGVLGLEVSDRYPDAVAAAPGAASVRGGTHGRSDRCPRSFMLPIFCPLSIRA